MSIPSPEQLTEYAEVNTEESVSPETRLENMPLSDEVLRPKFKSKLITPRKAIEKTRMNLSQLEQMTNKRFNISL